LPQQRGLPQCLLWSERRIYATDENLYEYVMRVETAVLTRASSINRRRGAIYHTVEPSRLMTGNPEEKPTDDQR